MAQFLVGNGADVQAQIYYGRKAFNLAITNGHKNVTAYLLSLGNDPYESGGSGYTPLMICAENNFYDLAALLLAQGVDVNAVHPGPGFYRGLRGWTPLVFAVRAGYVRMTQLLIAAGADVQHIVPAGVDGRGQPTPDRRVIDFASGIRADSIRRLLKEAGAA